MVTKQSKIFATRPRTAVMTTLFLIIVIAASLTTALAEVVTYPAPSGAPLSSSYNVWVNGQPVDIYDCRLTQYNARYGYFDFSGMVTVTVQRVDGNIVNVAILPRRLGIVPAVNGDTMTFTLTEPCNMLLEVNWSRGSFFLSANPIEVNPPQPGDPGVTYFGPGIHTITANNPAYPTESHYSIHSNEYCLSEGETIYIAGGAIVRGKFFAKNKSNIKVMGRGIIDGHNFSLDNFDNQHDGLIFFDDCTNVQVEGVCLMDFNHWTCKMDTTDDVTIDNLKIMTGRIKSTDGIDLVGCHRVTVKNCMIKCHDDGVAVKSLWSTDKRNVEDIEVRDTTIYTTLANAMEIGFETDCEYFDNVVFRRIDVLNCANSAISIHAGNGAIITNILFDDIEIEHAGTYTFDLAVLRSLWGGADIRGHVNGVLIRDVTLMETWNNDISPSQILGYDSDHFVENVTFENLVMLSNIITSASDGNFTINSYTTNIVFTAQSLISTQIVTDVDSLTVNEGTTNSFGLRLSRDISSAVTVSVAVASGDADLQIPGSSEYVFTTSNWNTLQFAAVYAAQDGDDSNGTALVRCSAPGMADVDISLTELDDDDFTPSGIGLSVTNLIQTVYVGEASSNQIIQIWNTGSRTITWAVSNDVSWASVSPAGGSSTGETDAITVSYNLTGLETGIYNGTLCISAAETTNSPRSVPLVATLMPPRPPIIETTLVAVADTRIRPVVPDSNYGNDTTMKCKGGDSEMLLKFDLSGIGSMITSAVLTLTLDADISGTVAGTAYRVHNQNTAWQETGATWNHRQTPSTVWYGGGAFDVTADTYNQSIGNYSLSSGTAGSTLDIALDGATLEAMRTNGNAGIHLDPTTLDTLLVRSKEHATTADRPQLTLYCEVSQAPNPDADGDGMDDSWEQTHFGDTTTATTNSDNDADGMLDWQEFVAGTQPTNHASWFRISNSQITENGNVLQWDAITGRYYNVYWSTSILHAPFIMYMTNVTVTGDGMLSVTDTTHSAEQSVYYRIDVSE